AQLQQRFADRVVLGGTLSVAEYYDLLWRSHIQVSTASHETLGISTLEAMYTRNACLLPNRCSYPEVTGGLTDALYSTREELIEKIERYLTDEPARAALADELHERSLRYTPERVVKAIADVVVEAVGDPASRQPP
ncbi:MAG: glycosyltransferase, partial [Dehalococcoidia bacterium]|nr:glycosyltransferase [Dehalococcoidia bacterium]